MGHFSSGAVFLSRRGRGWNCVHGAGRAVVMCVLVIALPKSCRENTCRHYCIQKQLVQTFPMYIETMSYTESFRCGCRATRRDVGDFWENSEVTLQLDESRCNTRLQL